MFWKLYVDNGIRIAGMLAAAMRQGVWLQAVHINKMAIKRNNHLRVVVVPK